VTITRKSPNIYANGTNRPHTDRTTHPSTGSGQALPKT